MDNLLLVDIVQSQFRVHSQEEQKLKSLNGCCLFAYQFYPLYSKDSNGAGGQAQAAAMRPVTADTPPTQTLSEIQRGTALARKCLQKSSSMCVPN